MVGFVSDSSEASFGISSSVSLSERADWPLRSSLVGNSSSEPMLAQIAERYADARGLSERESEVFRRFLLEGMPSKKIALALGIAYPTVKLYWARICRKLDCYDSLGATVAFLRETLASHDCPNCEPSRAQLSPEERLQWAARAFARQRHLSTRESEVFIRFVSAGKANKEIAVDLGIAYPTVKLYWTRICRKLSCTDATSVLRAFCREAVDQLACSSDDGCPA
jgi:DNA-binding NarL/FixJ family response regulator